MIASENAVEHATSALYGNEGAAKAMAQMRAESGIQTGRGYHGFC